MPEDILADLHRAAEVLGCDIVIVPDNERPAQDTERKPG